MSRTDTSDLRISLIKPVKLRSFSGDDDSGRMDDSEPDEVVRKKPTRRIAFRLHNDSGDNESDTDGPLDTPTTENALRKLGIQKQMSVSKLYNISRNYDVAYPCKDDREGRYTDYRQSFISLITGLYAINLVLMAIAFEVSVAMDPHRILHDQIFYLYLYVVSLLFFVFCDVFMFTHNFSWSRIFKQNRSENSTISFDDSGAANVMQRNRTDASIASTDNNGMREKVSHSSRSAGSLYLRLGCVVFGLAGLVFFGLDLFSEVSKEKCQPLVIINLTLAALFTFAQMFFIFRNSHLTIHRFKMICRFGTMHLVATNLSTWIRYLLIEELHVMHQVSENDHMDEDSSHEKTDDYKSVAVETLVHHPTVPNVSRIRECLSFGKHGFDFNCHYDDLKPFMTTCLIEYSIICAAVMFILWRNIGTPNKSRVRKQNFRVDCSSSTKGLFIGLFSNVIIIISMIIFFVQINSRHDDNALYILYTTDCALYVSSIFAILYGSYQMRNLSFVQQHKAKNLLLLDDILLFVGLLGQILFCLFSVVSLLNIEEITVMLILASVLRLTQVLLQTVYIVSAQRLIALTPFLQKKKPGREVVTFLIMVNLALFLVNTFETQKASAHPTMIDFYGKGTWTVLVHSMVPLTIFYRFHSTVCLAEIWKNAYREKTNIETE